MKWYVCGLERMEAVKTGHKVGKYVVSVNFDGKINYVKFIKEKKEEKKNCWL